MIEVLCMFMRTSVQSIPLTWLQVSTLTYGALSNFGMASFVCWIRRNAC